MVQRRVVEDDRRELLDGTVGLGREDPPRLLPDDTLAIVQLPGIADSGQASGGEQERSVKEHGQEQSDRNPACGLPPIEVGRFDVRLDGHRAPRPCTHKHLLADRLQRRSEVEPDQSGPTSAARLHRQRQEARAHLDHLIAVGGEEVAQADVRIDADMGVVVEIFAIGVAVIGLEDGQRAARRELGAKARQRIRKILSGVMCSNRLLAKAKSTLPSSIRERSVTGPTIGFDSMAEMRLEIPARGRSPTAARGDDIVDEIAIAAAEVQHGVRRANAVPKIIAPQRLPHRSRRGSGARRES